MSIVNSNTQWLQTVTGQYYNSIIGEPGLQSVANQLHAAAQPNLIPTVFAVLQRIFDTGTMPWSEAAVNDVIVKTIRGILYIEASRLGFAIDMFAQDGGFLQMVLNPQQAPQQQFVQPQQFSQPYIPQQPVMNTMSYQNPVNTYGTFGSPGGSASSVAALGPSLNVNNKENTMQQQNHLPVHTTKSPTELYAFKKELEPPKPETFVRDSNIKTIPVIDKTEVEITYDDGCQIAAVLFTRFPDALCKPVLFDVTETSFMPAFNPSQSLSTDMGKISECETMEDALDYLLALSHKYSINGVISWIDNRISHAVEMALYYRFGITMNGEFASVPSYREEMDQIDNFAESQVPGSVEILHSIVLHTLKEICDGFHLELLTGSEVEALEKEVNGTQCDYIGIVSRSTMLTLPWALRFTFGTNKIWTADATRSQIYDILDQAWTLSKKDLPSILVTDISNTRYRVYRIGKPTFGGGSYHFERIGF